MKNVCTQFFFTAKDQKDLQWDILRGVLLDYKDGDLIEIHGSIDAVSPETNYEVEVCGKREIIKDGFLNRIYYVRLPLA